MNDVLKIGLPAAAVVVVFLGAVTVGAHLASPAPTTPPPAAPAEPAAASAPHAPGNPPAAPTEVAIPGVGIPTVLQDGVAVDQGLADRINASITYTAAANSRDCQRLPYPGMRTADLLALATGPLAEDLAYQQRDWDDPRERDRQACHDEAARGYAVTATSTRAAIPNSADGRHRVVITYTVTDHATRSDERVGYQLEQDHGVWKIRSIETRPPLDF